MRKWQRWIATVFVTVITSYSAVSQAKTTLFTLGDGVIVYSGPATYYRPLSVLPAKTELKASSKIVDAREGKFYRVQVKTGEKQTAIGFIPVTADVRLSSDQLDEEDLEKFGAVALVNKAAQLSYSGLMDRHSIITLGYMHYLSPGFYVKGFAGRYATTNSNGTVGGGEIGNDALLFKNVSGLVSYSAGVFAPESKGAIFEASDNLNAMMQAAVGARYNFNGIASFSAALTQVVLFNANNSFVTHGFNVTLEVGL